MKRYLLFGGDSYYPGGGWDDFIKDFNTIEEARLLPNDKPMDWFQIVDTETMKPI